MEPILLAAAIGGFIIPFLNTLFAKYVNFLQEKWIASEVVVADVKGISMTILKIQAVVSQAEARQAVHDHGLILWLRVLKDAAYEADDLLDELNATVLQLKEKKRQQRNLQTLVLLQCESLKNLPEGICKLTNLRHLKIDRSLPSFTRKGRQTKVAGIGSLTLLQELEKFDCTDHRIGELKEMNELRGCLSIRGLENVESETEASKAMLANKRRLDILKLKWSRMDIVSASSELDLRVLEKLQPHPNIRKLTIARYRGINTPCWINKAMPSNLKVIKLHDCPYLKQLPSLGHLFFLEKLEICRMYGVTKVDYEFYGNTKEVKFPSLRKLSFCHMPKWKEWSARKEDQSFPCLIELFMKNCPNLETRPSFPPEVRIIEVCGTRSARS
ncbi:putative disease resistance RPP13-like protein 1 isoform X2 [Ananas comosus]|uniref:Disease resistance RPP13-like protein 1 isoform X2 n=1 Tax=Ananas comosus TaxID=4615 RepID=A0A6P5ER82_ANACO|nr:putative disease resistance RPP13-like protein 1 isoform X2 [Ananas comosus]